MFWRGWSTSRRYRAHALGPIWLRRTGSDIRLLWWDHTLRIRTYTKHLSASKVTQNLLIGTDRSHSTSIHFTHTHSQKSLVKHVNGERHSLQIIYFLKLNPDGMFNKSHLDSCEIESSVKHKKWNMTHGWNPIIHRKCEH